MARAIIDGDSERQQQRNDARASLTEGGHLRADARRNREQLLLAARDVFVERGPDAPLEDVAQRAGVGIGTLYRRFPDRQALLRAVALDVLARVTAEAHAALAVALVIGLINGLLVSAAGIPPFIVTLGFLGILRGGAYLLSSGQNTALNTTT